MIGIVGKKIGMSQIFTESGEVVPISIVEAGPCPVVQVKTPEKDGYAAVQLAFEQAKERLVKKPILGKFKAANLKPYRHLVEIRDFADDYCQVGKEVTVSGFQCG